MLARRPGKVARRFGVVWIVDKIMLVVGTGPGLVAINEDGVIEGQSGKSGEVADEKIFPRQSGVEVSVSFFLIFDAVLKEHSKIPETKIGGESASDILLQNFWARPAHLPQIGVAGEIDSLLWRGRRVPGAATRNLT